MCYPWLPEFCLTPDPQTHTHPVAQVRGQNQGGIVVNRDESRSHILIDNASGLSFKPIEKYLRLSPTGC